MGIPAVRRRGGEFWILDGGRHSTAAESAEPAEGNFTREEKAESREGGATRCGRAGGWCCARGTPTDRWAKGDLGDCVGTLSEKVTDQGMGNDRGGDFVGALLMLKILAGVVPAKGLSFEAMRCQVSSNSTSDALFKCAACVFTNDTTTMITLFPA